MIRLLLILIMHSLFISMACCQSLTIDELLTLSSLPPKNFDRYMNKKGFLQGDRSFRNDAMAITYFAKKRHREIDTLAIDRRVEMYKQDDTYCFALHTSSRDEYLDGRKRLRKAGFFCSDNSDTSHALSLQYQKRNVTVLANTCVEDNGPAYTFLLQKKELPDPAAIQYAEDLLKFNSHEYVVSFFGENNVKKDVYYFSEKELKKCSILFANTSQQVIFIWDDEANYCKLSYILISGMLPSLSAVQYTKNVGQNKWILKNGIYSGMSLKELLRLNGKDFDFYGRNSEFSFMVAPAITGSIDFKKTALTLGCFDCNGSGLLEKLKVSAADAVAHNLSLYIFYIMISR